MECTRDALANRTGLDVAQVARLTWPTTQHLIFDPFAGSCNTLYWILRHLPGARGVAFERDPLISDLTRRNIATLDAPIELRNGDYAALAPALRVPEDSLLIIFVAPPWGEAMSAEAGLDLRRTTPPITGIVDYFDALYSDHPILFVAQVYERMEASSLNDLRARFVWSDMRMYDINVAGMNHGILLGARL